MGRFIKYLFAIQAVVIIQITAYVYWENITSWTWIKEQVVHMVQPKKNEDNVVQIGQERA
jgi:hypothetical protein